MPTSKTPRLAVANQKGGVGKTTIAINTAAALSEQEHNVLLVDLDPQGNATEHLGYMDAYDEVEPNLYSVLTNPDQREEITGLVRDHEEMDVLPSNIDMTAVEPELTMMRRSGEQLDAALEYVEDDYDAVVIDTPPFLGFLMDNALFAARNVLIPALAESTSKRAFELLFDHESQLERDYEIQIEEVGVVINRIDVRKKQANEMVEWIEEAFDGDPVYQLRERADVQKSLAEHQSLFAFNEDSDQIPTLRDLGDALETQLGVGR